MKKLGMAVTGPRTISFELKGHVSKTRSRKCKIVITAYRIKHAVACVWYFTAMC
jgi:hypothetical protein